MPTLRPLLSPERSPALWLHFHHSLVGSFPEAGGLGEKCNCYEQAMSTLCNVFIKKAVAQGFRGQQAFFSQEAEILKGTGSFCYRGGKHGILQQTACPADAGDRVSSPPPSDTALSCLLLRSPPRHGTCTWSGAWRVGWKDSPQGSWKSSCWGPFQGSMWI